MNITLRQLRAFLAVATCGNFTGAAKQLNLTQSALSILVRELEAELGIRLFDRNTRKVELSAAGRDFYPFAEKIQQDLDAAIGSVTSLKDFRRGIVRIASPQLMSCTLMPRVIAAYRARYPDIQLVLVDTLPELVVQKVATQEVDLGVGPEGVQHDEIHRAPLLSDRHLLVCTKDHPLAQLGRVTWKDLEPYPFIAQTRDYNARLLLDLNMWSNNLQIKPVYEVSYMTTTLGMVASGLGITACPSYAEPLVKAYQLEMKPLNEPEFIREVCIFTKVGTLLSPAAESFVSFMQEFVKK
ncbi:LysR family transcriptional regulator [Massilia sp. METH4]|uniref:LysR family transcriptional regulator n=1 Tax=Massilia sp. METH4 TaxID=3123041 RepID=UPI0030D15844